MSSETPQCTSGPVPWFCFLSFLYRIERFLGGWVIKKMSFWVYRTGPAGQIVSQLTV